MTKVYVDFIIYDHHHERHLPEERLITVAKLPGGNLSLVFSPLAAEGAVHGISPEQVHFLLKLGPDAIIDIVGTCSLLIIGIERPLAVQALLTGGGTIEAAIGIFVGTVQYQRKVEIVGKMRNSVW